MAELNTPDAVDDLVVQEPPVPPSDATEREHDEAAMAWLRWYHLHRIRGDNPTH